MSNNIKDLTVEQLKVAVYDNSMQMQVLQESINRLNQEIHRRAVEAPKPVMMNGDKAPE